MHYLKNLHSQIRDEKPFFLTSLFSPFSSSPSFLAQMIFFCHTVGRAIGRFTGSGNAIIWCQSGSASKEWLFFWGNGEVPQIGLVQNAFCHVTLLVFSPAAATSTPTAPIEQSNFAIHSAVLTPTPPPLRGQVRWAAPPPTPRGGSTPPSSWKSTSTGRRCSTST